MEKVFGIHTRTTQERLWEAIADPGIRSKYNFDTRLSSDWTPGSRLEVNDPKADRPRGWCSPWSPSGATR